MRWSRKSGKSHFYYVFFKSCFLYSLLEREVDILKSIFLVTVTLFDSLKVFSRCFCNPVIAHAGSPVPRRCPRLLECSCKFHTSVLLSMKFARNFRNWWSDSLALKHMLCVPLLKLGRTSGWSAKLPLCLNQTLSISFFILAMRTCHILVWHLDNSLLE